MRLRAEPPKSLRLSRKVALTGAAGLAVAIAAAAVVGLSTQDDAAPVQELTPSSAPPPEAVRALPGDYAAPRLTELLELQKIVDDKRVRASRP